MAKSNNRRKNGKKVKNNTVQRMRRLALEDLKGLIICNVVDRDELSGEEFKMKPRTLVYHKDKGVLTNVTPLQERALKTERWRWNIHSGIICRKQDGTVYFDKEENIYTVTDVLLTEMNSYIADGLTERFQQCNKLHALTMFWVAAPFDIGDVPLEAILAPVWKFNVLGNVLTRWENDNQDKVISYYKAKTLKEFCMWFIQQDKYRQKMKELRDLKFYFEPTGEKMKKGELMSYRSQIQEVMGEITTVKFEPTATVKGFCKPKFEPNHWFMACNGEHMSKLMTVLEQCPPCVNCIVEVDYLNGENSIIKFSNGEVDWK